MASSLVSAAALLLSQQLCMPHPALPVTQAASLGLGLCSSWLMRFSGIIHSFG